MSYRKFKADHLFTGLELLGDNYVLITKENGEVVEIVDEKEAGDFETFKGIISPGFVNAHCHLELSHMKNVIPENTGLIDFVFKVVTERHFEEEEILQAIQNAENEMLKNGIVAVGDICNNLHTLHQKQKNNLRYYNFIECSGWLPAIAQTRFERALNFYNQFLNRKSIVPHAPYSVSNELWQLMAPYFENKVVSIHNQETAFEDEFFTHGTGDFVRMYEMMKIDNSFYSPGSKSSLQTYFRKLEKAASMILVHNTFTKQNDIDYVKENTATNQLVSFCICINANQYIENAVPPVDMLVKSNCNIVIGTDSLASNHQLNILEELKIINKFFPQIKIDELLKWVTINGAKALQMNETLGSFEKGKKPGVICLNLDFPDYKINRII